MMKNILAPLLNSAVVLAVCASGLMLFHFNQQARSLEHELNRLNKAIKSETIALRTLKAEWAHLSRPERIIKHAQNLLPELVPTTAGQIYNFQPPATEFTQNSDGAGASDVSLLQQYLNSAGQ